MANIFDKLFEIADSADSLDKFLNAKMQAVNEFYNSNYSNILSAKNSIERFTLLKNNVISKLDFTKSYTKSFVLMLLDYCERFNFIAATPHIYRILYFNNIQINSRLLASLHFLYPRPTTNTELVERFNCICDYLQSAIDTEEDNDKKSIATFLNYYSIIINDTSIQFVEQVKDKIVIARSNDNYKFLYSETITELLNIDLQDKDSAYIHVQDIIDRILEKEEVYEFLPDIKIETDEFDQEEILIETDTNYSRELISTPKNFDSIRSISVVHADGSALTNRGVKILDSEEELYEYMKRFGNMHKAKLQTAFEALPKNLPTKVDIVDWGCGQGIASMIFIQNFSSDIINSITLIEPSIIAIKRAALHVRKFNESIPIKTISKKLDELEGTDISDKQVDITIHLFSNILDIDDYSQKNLIELIESTQSGVNYFVCASPYIDEIKTDRLESFKRYFENNYSTSFESQGEETNTGRLDDEYWNCNNNYNGNMNGRFCPYPQHPTCGCHNKWTRVIRVFKVEL